MISPAKLNLGLSVLYKRPDNYHELKSIFVRLNWGDEISFAPAPGLELVSVNELPPSRKHFFEEVSERGDLSRNILAKTWNFLCDITGKKEGVRIHLVKRIPPGGGLGGGSTNAASLILYFLEKHSIPLDHDLIRKISGIGADIPFFLYPHHALVGGIGEKISPVKLASGYGILCIPAVSINTSELYAKLKKPLQKDPPAEPWDKLESDVKVALENGAWNILQGKLDNDFEKIVFQENPELAAIKESLLECGAGYSSMTGSGSSIYALCRNAEEQEAVSKSMKRFMPELYQVLFDF